MRDVTTWRTSFDEARRLAEDDTPLVAVAPSLATLDVEFDAGHGSSEGPDVLIWTEARVYFPVVYDGAEWLQSAPRNPGPEGQGHVGGE